MNELSNALNLETKFFQVDLVLKTKTSLGHFECCHHFGKEMDKMVKKFGFEGAYIGRNITKKTPNYEGESNKYIYSIKFSTKDYAELFETLVNNLPESSYETKDNCPIQKILTDLIIKINLP